MDHCTLWPDRLFGWDWHACCEIHDRSYEIGIPQSIADSALRECVNAVLPVMGDIMWLGVTIFGCIFYLMAQRRRNQSKAR